MKKIPTIFVRDFANKGKITEAWHPDCLWVRDGEGFATVKLDGSACLLREGAVWKRREVKADQAIPERFELCGRDSESGKLMGWVPVGAGPDDRWHLEALVNALAPLPDGTYELIGPKVNGGREPGSGHRLIRHGPGRLSIEDPPARTREAILGWLTAHVVEGIVWHHPDGRMAKIKRRDFGLAW